MCKLSFLMECKEKFSHIFSIKSECLLLPRRAIDGDSNLLILGAQKVTWVSGPKETRDK